ncbi:hypothetical protein D3C76_1594480 [compost metagenome]
MQQQQLLRQLPGKLALPEAGGAFLGNPFPFNEIIDLLPDRDSRIAQGDGPVASSDGQHLAAVGAVSLEIDLEYIVRESSQCRVPVDNMGMGLMPLGNLIDVRWNGMVFGRV